jgi:ankyrin repeat protein
MIDIHRAIESHNYDAVADILRDDPKQIELQSKLGWTPLHTAIHHEQLVIADLLVKSGANIDIQNHHGDTPLHYAAQNEDAAITEFLINYGANLELENREGLTPLMLASLASHEVAEILLEHGAHLDLLSAIRLGYKDQVQELLQKKTRGLASFSGERLLIAAVMSHNVEILNLLFENGILPSEDQTTERSSLFTAVEQALPERDLTFVRLLLEHGANPLATNSRGDSVLKSVETYGKSAGDISFRDELCTLLKGYVKY